MKIIPLAHQVIGKLVLVGLLFSPFALTPSYAAELVGKPVPVGSQAAASAEQEPSEAEEMQEEILSTDAPAPAIAPAPVAPPIAAEPCASQNMDDMRKAIDELREAIHNDMSSGFNGVSLGPDVIVPVIAMLLLFGGPILLLIVLAVLHYRAKARRQQNINRNIDKLLAEGKDIPLEMLLGEEAAVAKPMMRSGFVATTTTAAATAAPRNDNTLQKGVRNIGLGTGWLLFLTIMFNIKIGSFGFIFIGLGISQLVIWKLSNTGANVPPVAETPEPLKVQD